MSNASIGAIFLIVFVINFFNATSTTRVKCCQYDFVLSNDLKKCVKKTDSFKRTDYSSISELELFENGTHENTTTCFQGINIYTSSAQKNSTSNHIISSCIDFQTNGSLAYNDCSSISNLRSNNDTCDSVFTQLNFYGATMMIFANIIYLIIYVLVCLLYIFMPGICRRAYDKAVLSYTITQTFLSTTVITLGYHKLCHKQLNSLAYSFIGLSLMTWTISGVYWLLVISFDIASTITKFRWAPASGAKGRDENHKFRVYLVWVIAGTIIPVTISGSLEFSPLSDDNIIKPNFHDHSSNVNYRVIVHVATVPVLVAIASNVLFIYTTARMFNIQKSTSVANENRKKSVKEKYILYLKLYLLMDAPYVTGALGSAYEDLWILKFVRIFQPIFMLYAVLPRNVVLDVLRCKKKPIDEKNQIKPKTVRETNDAC